MNRFVTMGQNEAPTGLPNVLHDQGLPNTLGGVGVAALGAGLPWRGLAVLAALAALATLLVLMLVVYAG